MESAAPSHQFRDWSYLPDLPLGQVVGHLVPSLDSLAAFAATCRPWRLFLRTSASTILARIPPLLLHPDPTNEFYRLRPLMPLVTIEPIDVPLAGPPSTLLSSSRGFLILLDRPRGRLLLADALTGAERHALPLPSPNYPYQYSALTSTHLLLFVSKHALVSLPFPPPTKPTPDWTHHRVPHAASFITAVIEFRGRVLGVTDRGQLLEFRLDADISDQTVQILPTTGLPNAATFDRWQFGPRLVAAGARLLLLLLMTDQDEDGAMAATSVRVRKVSVHALNMEGVSINLVIISAFACLF